MKTIVIGLGNPILGDDGVGWKVAEEVHTQLNSPHSPLFLREGNAVDITCLSLGGLGLMEHLIGYQRAILIDAFQVDDDPGSILILKLSDLPNYSAYHTASAHDTSLAERDRVGQVDGR
jgi:hydrogenase maturation protease